MALQTQLSEQQKEQYTLTRETIEIINRKCHDMKHQVAALRQMQQTEARDAYCREVENSIQIYDSTIQTGSEVLDTVLTGKSLYCEAHQIVLTCVADGEKLAFLDPMDLYTIFGNALDNAIESVSQVEDAEKRLISVSIWERNGLVLIQMENYYEGELTQNTQTGLPATTKNSPENHGFGLKSILSTIEKYQGHMTIHTENSIFILRISFPKVERE
jgi:sensor histidine kinase regulating citrate/malate metabolism